MQGLVLFQQSAEKRPFQDDLMKRNYGHFVAMDKIMPKSGQGSCHLQVPFYLFYGETKVIHLLQTLYCASILQHLGLKKKSGN